MFKIRKVTATYRKSVNICTRFLVFLAVVLLGVLLGYVSEWLEYGIYYSTHSTLNYHNDILIGLGFILNHFSIWIFCATMISYFSWGPNSAGIHTFSFLLAMCVAYFIPKHMHYGYAVDTQLLIWGAVAFLSIGAAVLIWFAKNGGLYGVIIKSLPIAGILTESIVIVFNQLKSYHPIPGAPAQPLQWLLQTKLTLLLAVHVAFIIVLIFSLSKSLLERLRIILFALTTAAMLSILFILLFQ